jgi:ABC-2 type transport system ATP-binding protein
VPGVVSAVATGNRVRIEVDELAATRVVLEQLVGAGVTSIQTSLPSLEEVYVSVFGERGLTVRRSDAP